MLCASVSHNIRLHRVDLAHSTQKPLSNAGQPGDLLGVLAGGYSGQFSHRLFEFMTEQDRLIWGEVTGQLTQRNCDTPIFAVVERSNDWGWCFQHFSPSLGLISDWSRGTLASPPNVSFTNSEGRVVSRSGIVCGKSATPLSGRAVRAVVK